MRPQPIIVAIDGPAGSGKSTVARALSRRLGLPYLDTGAMYRAVAMFALERGVDPDDREAVSALARVAPLELRQESDGGTTVLLAGAPVEPRIRAPEVAAATSRLAVHPEVREHMIRLQREVAARGGGVIEGRDIGTRVVPETPYKFYLSADPGVRARRRLHDLREAGRSGLSEGDVRRELDERDERDAGRSLSPLAPAADAEIVDTSGASVEEIVDRLLAIISRRSALEA